MLWDLQPWVAFFIPAIFWKIKTGLHAIRKKNTSVEWISLCGFIIPFIALSASRYKLPHYIFPLFPFAAIILASFLVLQAERISIWLKGLQWFIIHFLICAAIASMVWAFPLKNPILYAVVAGLYFLIWWFWKKSKDASDRIILPTLIGAFILQLILSVHFYPHLLRFQSSSQAGKYIEKENSKFVCWHDRYGYALDYYSDRVRTHWVTYHHTGSFAPLMISALPI
jgi:4-amino-4-deoxy-L-arabinose transferase-like glycosyltransferase